MMNDNISEIGIDNLERLYIVPEKKEFSMIWRSAAEVHWDTDKKFLFSPKPREWSYYQWYCHVIDIVRVEYGCQLLLTINTKWINVPDQLRNILNEALLELILSIKRLAIKYHYSISMYTKYNSF